VTAGVLSGSVAGDHVSPISDTTVMSALACDIKLLAHVQTQVPYVLFSIIVSIIFGTIPIGYGGYPNIVGFILGWGLTVVFTYVVCKPIMSPTGAWDPLNWIMMKLSPDPRLQELAEDVVRVVTAGEDVSGEYMSKHWEPEPEETHAMGLLSEEQESGDKESEFFKEVVKSARNAEETEVQPEQAEMTEKELANDEDEDEVNC